jgi:hypothetical protein
MPNIRRHVSRQRRSPPITAQWRRCCGYRNLQSRSLRSNFKYEIAKQWVRPHSDHTVSNPQSHPKNAGPPPGLTVGGDQSHDRGVSHIHSHAKSIVKSWMGGIGGGGASTSAWGAQHLSASVGSISARAISWNRLIRAQSHEFSTTACMIANRTSLAGAYHTS